MSKKKKLVQSEAEGLIPELRFPEFKDEREWDKLNLSNVSDVIMGSSPSSTSYNENKIGLPLLQGNADIKNRLSAPRIYTTEITKECKVGDILLSVRAPVGTVAKSLHNACIGRGISALRAKKPNLQEYLYQWLFSYESSWEKISQGGTFDAVNSDDIRNLLVPIPNPKEQQKIASCLSSLDVLIEAHSQKLDLLKDHKKGLMQNLFPLEGEEVPKYRFKEFVKDGRWQKTTIDAIAKVSAGGTPESTNPEYWNGKIPWMNSGELNNKRIYSVSNFITSKGLKESSTKLIPPNCVLIGLAGQGKTRGTAAINYIELCTNQSIGAIHPNLDVFNSEFLYQKIDSMYEKLRYLSTGDGGRGGLNLQIIKEIELLLPKTGEQQKIASCLSSLDEIITAQAEKIEQLKLHKKGMLQGLFPKMTE